MWWSVLSLLEEIWRARRKTQTSHKSLKNVKIVTSTSEYKATNKADNCNGDRY
jgi:hypothetical protein